MHPSLYAETAPDRPAIIMATSGETTTYRELNDRSNQGAQLFRSLGLQIGDGVAIMMENNAIFLEIVWAAQRAGLRFTAISSRLTPPEVEYIVKDAGAKALVISKAMENVAVPLASLIPGVSLLMTGGTAEPYKSYEAERDRFPATPIADEKPGAMMLYSSGTTGRPKGVKRPLPEGGLLAPDSFAERMIEVWGYGEDTVYLCPAPLYHAAPVAWSMTVQRIGGTVVIMEKYDAEQALATIQNRRVTHAQFVPTHFVRMLKLPPEVRSRYDTSSLRHVIHAAAPCPVPVKEQMMEWWGPIIWEQYSGTEGNGMTMATPQEWLAHKGTVGRSVAGELKICDENGEPLPPRTEGVVYFSGGGTFEYHNAPEKVAESTNKYGWTTLGDVGWVDEDGWLFLTDRRNFMIISGGVNIYPQEVENLLITHPRITDAAVVGAPDPDMGERVVAVIQPADWADATDDFKSELTAYCRQKLSGVKTPRQIDFMKELPRDANGKLYKRLIRDAYWGKSDSRIV